MEAGWIRRPFYRAKNIIKGTGQRKRCLKFFQTTRSLASMMEPIRYGGWMRRPFYRAESTLKGLDREIDV
jgi:hypothetical protein